MQAVEHILLESDERTLPQRQTARRIHTSHRFHSHLRRRVVELEIIDYYYLFCRQRNWRAEPIEFVLDLCFVDSSVRRSRHIPWRWLAVTAGFLGLALLLWMDSSMASSSGHIRLLVGALLLLTAGCGGLISVYRLTERLELRSVHGQAQLLELTGGLGTLRSLHPFMIKLRAHVRIAAGTRRNPKSAHLRDEMREHYRLKEAGVLSNGQYEQSKRRILAHHPAA